MERGYKWKRDTGVTWRRDTYEENIHEVETDKEREHMGKGHIGSGEIHEEWGHTWRMGTYGEGIHIEWGQTRRWNIHGEWIHMKRGYRTYTEKRHIWSGDILGENIHGVGTEQEREHMGKRHTGSGKIYEEWGTYIENGNIRRGDTHGMGTNTETRHIRRGDTHEVETYTEKGYRTYKEKGQMEWKYK